MAQPQSDKSCCPVCGRDPGDGGWGPCSAACEQEWYELHADRRDFAEEYAREAACAVNT